jgi:hypothetical protein
MPFSMKSNSTVLLVGPLSQKTLQGGSPCKELNTAGPQTEGVPVQWLETRYHFQLFQYVKGKMLH